MNAIALKERGEKRCFSRIPFVPKMKIKPIQSLSAANNMPSIQTKCACGGGCTRCLELIQPKILKDGWNQKKKKKELALHGIVDCKVNKSGDPVMKIFDTSCTRPCTDKHEKKHYEDMKPCCNKFHRAFLEATKGSILSIEDKIYMEKLYQLAFDIWKFHSRSWKEIRAFNEILLKDDGGNCYDKLREENKCSENPMSHCCRLIDEHEKQSIEQQKYYMKNLGMGHIVGCDVNALLNAAKRIFPKPKKVERESLFKKEKMHRYMDEYMRRKILESVHGIPGHEPETLAEPEN